MWPEWLALAAGVLLYSGGARAELVPLLLLAAGGMWWLALAVGAGAFARTWAGLAFGFSGMLAAFTMAGDRSDRLLLGAAMVPWLLGFSFAAVVSRRPLMVGLGAAALGGGLIAVGPAFAWFALPALAVLALVSGVRAGPERSPSAGPGFAWNPALLLGIVAVLGLGFGAAGWLPSLAGSTGTAGGTVTPGGLVEALFDRMPGAGAAGYAYVGRIPLLFALGLIPALLSPQATGWDRRRGAALGAIFALALAAVSVISPAQSGAGVAHIGGTVVLLALAAIGLDWLSAWCVANRRPRRVYVPDAVRAAAAVVGIATLLLLAGISVLRLFQLHHPWLRSAPGVGLPAAAPGQAPEWLAWLGVAMTLLALVPILALLVSDARRRTDRIDAEAVVADGALVPQTPLGLSDGTSVHVTVTPAGTRLADGSAAAATAAAWSASDALDAATAAGGAVALPAAPRAGALLQARLAGRSREATLAWILFGASMLVYLLTRLWGIERFPIYFFADEATHSVLAQDLLNRGFKDGLDRMFPIYFEAAGNRWTPLLSVYVHAISVELFGKSVFVTRATGAIVSLLGAAAVAFTLKWIFKARFWWAGALLMAIAPAWFLHSRTGFETVMMSSFFACFLLCYLLYRTRSPLFIFPAVGFGAATFYTYSNGQMVIAAATVLLLLSDIRYHLRNWKVVLLGLLLTVLLAVPVLRFRAEQPESMTTHLRAIDSYWFKATPLSEKLAEFGERYAYGLSPAYWFVPNGHDLARHRMRGYGNLQLLSLPFFLVGVGLCLWRIRSAPHRAVLLAALATPVGAALVDVSITRVLAFVGPACILIGLGVEFVLGMLLKGSRAISREADSGIAAVPADRFSYVLASGVVFAVLAGGCLVMTRDALANGPRWYGDYGLYGMQYGAKQLFEDEIPAILASQPETRINVSSTWANGADTFTRFFLSPEQQARVQMTNVDYYMDGRRNLDRNTLLIMTPNEHERAIASGKFRDVVDENVVPYPDGSPGFYFTRLEYADDLEQTLAREREERSQPVNAEVTVDGESWALAHSQLDMGQIKDIFDGDTFTLMRGLQANPFTIDIRFPTPRPIQGLTADFGSMDFTLTAEVFEDPEGAPVTYSETYRGLPPDPHVELAFDGGPVAASRVRLAVQQLNAGDDVHIHFRELAFE